MVTIIVALIGAIGGIIAAVIAALNHNQNSQIKVMVDGRLDQALTEIKSLKAVIQGRKDVDTARETAELHSEDRGE
jgi:ABC-type transporter MlaC component